MPYPFASPIPLPWFLADLVTLLASLAVVLYLVRTSSHPVAALLESFSFVFLYASVFENFAVGQGWYVYGRSLLMIGEVPLSVPLVEMDVLMIGLRLVEKLEMPAWSKPLVIGLLGMLQDFSLDPVAVRQLFTVGGVRSGRWTWLLPAGAVNIYGIPVYNFPGWMLIMAYAASFLLLGRWWFRRSGFRPIVGCLYPFAALLLALLAMVSPLSQFLLWLAPFFTKGSSGEWIMLAVHLLVPSVLLAALWRGKMREPILLPGDLVILAVPAALHLADILFVVAGGYERVLWLVVLASLVHLAFLGLVFALGVRIAKGAKDRTTSAAV